MAYTVGAFQKAIETQTVPPDVQARLQKLKEQGDQLNLRWARVAKLLNQRLAG